MTIYTYNVTSKKTNKVYTYYVADCGRSNGKRLRKTFSNLKDARDWMNSIKRQKDKYGTVATVLTPSQLVLAVEAYKLIGQAEMDDGTLIEAVRSFIEQSDIAVSIIALKDAYDMYLSGFDPDKQAEHYKTIKKVMSHFVAFIGEEVPVHKITETKVKEYFSLIDGAMADKTYNNKLTYIKTFFNWCVENKHAKENPVTLSTKRIAYEDPVFVKVEDLQCVLHDLETNQSINSDDRMTLINFISLSYFCGLRSSEIYRLPIDAIHPEDAKPFVRVSTTKGAARGVKGRIVDLEDNVVAWLKKYPFASKISESKMKQIRDRLRKYQTQNESDVFDAIMVRNVARHSYITYHTAKYRDYARTEAYVGTSASMRCRHYQGLATTAAGEAYFSLYPSS
jgi:site-specific recombinase XerD